MATRSPPAQHGLPKLVAFGLGGSELGLRRAAGEVPIKNQLVPMVIGKGRDVTQNIFSGSITEDYELTPTPPTPPPPMP